MRATVDGAPENTAHYHPVDLLEIARARAGIRVRAGVVLQILTLCSCCSAQRGVFLARKRIKT